MTVFSTDTVQNAFSTVDTDGVTVDEDGGDVTVDFKWDEVQTVTVDAPPHEEAFDTDKFYKIDGAALARPIKQYYVGLDGDLVERQKPAAELRKAAWSFDNAPYTLTHPDTGMIKKVSDVRGFFRKPRYDGDAETLMADLYIPTGDVEVLEFIEDSQDLSIGFYNDRVKTYDGAVGSLTSDEPEEYQVNLYGDHVASVETGRCSSAEGCGLPMSDADDATAMDWDETTSYHTQKDQTMQSGSWVEWDASGGTAYGKIDEIVRDGCTTRGKGDMEVCAEEDDPATVVEVYDDESGESKDEFVRHKMSELRSWSGPSTDSWIRTDEMDKTPPQAAQDNAQKVLGWKDEGKVPDSCGTEVGWRRARQLAEGGPVSWDTIGRMSMFARQEENSGVDEGEEPHTDCGHVMWLAWGGDAGVNWANDMMDKKDSETDAMNISIESKLTEGAVVRWDAIDGLTGYVVHAPSEEPYYMVNLLMDEDGEWRDTKRTLTVGVSDVWGLKRDDQQVWAWDVVPELSKEDVMGSMETEMNADYREGDQYFAISPDETSGDEPKYPINNCSDVSDAWHLRAHGDYDIEQSTLESRIKERANELGCEDPEPDEDMDSACPCADSSDEYNRDYYTSEKPMTEDSGNGFNVSVSVDADDITVDSLASEFDAVADLRDERNEYAATMDEMRETLDLDEDECPCDHVAELKETADEAEQLREDLAEYREDEKEEQLDHLVTELNADREEWEDASLDEIETEIDRREEILDDVGFSVKNADGTGPEGDVDSDGSKSHSGTRRFGRGYNA